MFNLVEMDVFRETDIILTVKTTHCDERLQLYLEKLKELGMEVHAYSDRGDHRQYLLVPDRDKLHEQLLQSCRNSAGSLFPDAIIKTPVPGEPVV